MTVLSDKVSIKLTARIKHLTHSRCSVNARCWNNSLLFLGMGLQLLGADWERRRSEAEDSSNMLTGAQGGLPGSAAQTELRGLEEMVPQTPHISDILCQVAGGLSGWLAGSLAHSRCSVNVC